MPDAPSPDADRPTSTDAAEAERAVRQYLQWLRDPASLVDPQLIASLEAEAEAATDPLERLKIWSRLQRARSVDGDRFQLGFIRWAKVWADANEVTAEAFQQAGVDDTLLRAAGIGLTGARGRGRTVPAAPRAAAGDAPTARRGSVGVQAIKDAVAGWSGEFVLADVVAQVGGSPMTVRKAVDELVEAGTVRRLGPRVGHQGPGRAPIVFRVV